MKTLKSLLKLLFLAPVMLLLGVTPTYGTATFVGAQSGKTYSKDLYISDVAAALVTWDGGQGASATSPTDWIPPEPVVLTDLSIVTGPTVIFKLQLIRNSIPTGDILRLVPHLTTNSMRPPLRIGFGAMQRAQIGQLT